MDDLIKALTIFRKYTDAKWPTHCEHDVLYVMVDPSKVSAEDTEELKNLSFNPNTDLDNFESFRFGSN